MPIAIIMFVLAALFTYRFFKNSTEIAGFPVPDLMSGVWAIACLAGGISFAFASFFAN